MFQHRIRTYAEVVDPSPCIRLPAAVAFPPDPRLLERMERSRSALPPDSIKPLRWHVTRLR
jgi:hypothetical protein